MLSMVVVLRGTVPQKSVTQVNSLQQVTSVDTLSLREALWKDDFRAPSQWKLSYLPNATQAKISISNSLSLTANFSLQPDPQSVVAYRFLNISLDQTPFVLASISVSSGVHYGVRFLGVDSNGKSFNAWSEGSNLQHRPGVRVYENITANLVLETYLASGQPPTPGSRVIRIQFYLEAVPGTAGTFTMQVSSLAAFPLRQDRSPLSPLNGDFRGLVINVNPLTSEEALLQAYVNYYIRGTSDLKYTLYFSHGSVILAQGFTYVQKGVTSYEIAVLTPQLIRDFPPFLPVVASWSVIIATQQGEINFFELTGLEFRFTSQPLVQDAAVDPVFGQFLLAYYFVFLFIAPIASTVLLFKVFKRED